MVSRKQQLVNIMQIENQTENIIYSRSPLLSLERKIRYIRKDQAPLKRIRMPCIFIYIVTMPKKLKIHLS